MTTARPAGNSHEGEPHAGGLDDKLNRLRAGVLGANDGIISTAGIVVGVAGASSNPTAIFVAGLAGLVAGALSMAGGEYTSVSAQRDTETAVLDQERRELATMPDAELEELTGLYRDKGLSPDLAHRVAVELTERDALAAHADAELGIADPNHRSNPWQAALSSFVAFTVGALLPLLAIVLPPVAWRVPVTVLSVLVALGLTAWAAARLGGARPVRPVARNVVVGLATMIVTFVVGSLFHV